MSDVVEGLHRNEVVRGRVPVCDEGLSLAVLATVFSCENLEGKGVVCFLAGM